MNTREQTIPGRPEKQTSHRRQWVLAILVALAIRFAVVAFVYPDFLVPGRNHWEFGYEIGKVADSIANGHGFANPYWVPTGPTAMLTPVYPYLMSLSFLAFGTYTKAAALAVLGFNSLVSALICIPIFFLTRHSFGLRPAIAAVWLWAFFPYAIYFSASSMWYHSLLALFLTALLWIASRLETRTQLWMWSGCGILWGIAALTTPVVLAVVPFLGGWACYRLNANGKSWKLPAFTLAVTLVATITPWMIRNDVVFQRPVFLKDNFWMELCVGNLGDAQHWWNDAVHPAGNNAELDAFRQLGELGYMARERAQGIDFLEHHPGIFVWRSMRRVIFMWTGFWSFRRDYLRGEPLDLFNILFATPVTIVALFGLRKALRHSWRAVMPYALVLLTFPLAYYFTHSDISYRQPIDPEVVILVAVALFWRPQPESQGMAPAVAGSESSRESRSAASEIHSAGIKRN